MAKLKEYVINYDVSTYTPACVRIMANSKEEAEEEFDRIVDGENVKHKANRWIDMDTIFDVEWEIEKV